MKQILYVIASTTWAITRWFWVVLIGFLTLLAVNVLMTNPVNFAESYLGEIIRWLSYRSPPQITILSAIGLFLIISPTSSVVSKLLGPPKSSPTDTILSDIRDTLSHSVRDTSIIKENTYRYLLQQEREYRYLLQQEDVKKTIEAPKELQLLYLDNHNGSNLTSHISPGTHIPNSSESNDFTLRFRVVEEPLTASNLTIILSSLTELSTKYWLITQRRFTDLIEYTQTHNSRFTEEANVVITRITYNSPMNMDWKVDLSAPSVAEALVKTIDGITQSRKRLEQAELENQAKAQEIRRTEQQTNHEQQMAALEREKQQLEIEQQRLELLEKRLEIQKKGIEYALEIANKVVDTLHPGADSATRAMEIQAILPNLIQLQNGKGLELALPVQEGVEKA